MTQRYILDASAILAFMSNEPGTDRVREVLLAGVADVSAVNISEVAAKLVSRGMPVADAELQCRSMGMDILETNEEIAFLAAAMMPRTQPLSLSLGDRICLATAIHLEATAMTAEKAWRKIPGVKVEVVR